MAATAVVEDFDIIKHICPGIITRPVDRFPDPLFLALRHEVWN